MFCGGDSPTSNEEGRAALHTQRKKTKIVSQGTSVDWHVLANLMADSVNLFKPPVWIDQNIKKAVEEKGTAS